MLIWLIADAMSPALTTYIAQNIGAGKRKRVKNGAVIGVGMSAVAIIICSLILFVASPLIASLFVSKTDAGLIVPMVNHYMKLMEFFYVFYSLAEAFAGGCCGMGDTLYPMVITFICTCLLRVLCIWFVLPRFQTMECIIGIYIASWITAGVAFTIMYFIKRRQELAYEK